MGDRYEQRTRVMEREPPRDDGPPPPWWQEHWWIWLIVLLLIVGGIIAFFALRGGGGGDDDRALVPDVVGLEEDAARRQIEQAGFDVDVVREPSAEAEEGLVVAQEPGAGSRLARGQTVVITVSTGPPETQTETETVTETETAPTETAETEPPPTTSMPDAVGQSYADASAGLFDEGLRPDGFAVPSSEPAGTVVAQEPEPGTEVEEGASVRLNVSIGDEGRPPTEVPDVTGPELAEAYAACVDAGFTCRIVEREAPSPEEVGEVIDQRPAAGSTAQRWAQITLALGT